ncbi:MAG: ABC transporter permease [Bauldia sp.]|nr:ABC transporter permease [Bauldia sp.]
MTWELFAVFIGSSIRFAIPLLFASVGELVSERGGVLNMSLEGMMLTAAFVAAATSQAFGDPMMGLLCGVIAAMLVALLQAFLSNTLRANQIVTGIGINILAIGGTTLALREIFGARASVEVSGFGKWSPPLLGDIPIFGGPVFTQVWLAYLAIALVAGVWFVLRYTAIGVVIAAVGEDPQAARKAGISVVAVRYGVVLFAGFTCGLGGAFLSIGDLQTFTENMINGAGYIAIAAVIFGNWKLGRTVAACFVFGTATALQYQLPAMGVNVPNALLIMSPYLLALIAVAGLAGRQRAPTALTVPYWGR